MNRHTYYRGIPGKQYGIWNKVTRAFRPDVREDSPMLATARLFFILGDGAKDNRYESRMLPDRRE